VKPFDVVCADPPWSYGDSLPGKARGAVKHYGCLPLAEIKDYRLPPVAKDALLFLWCVEAMPQEALDVVSAWGFTPKTSMVWAKLTRTGKRHFGMGRFVRASHERCIIATRGRGIDLVRDHSIRSVFEAPVGRHSEKPDEFYALVAKMTSGRRCELFARRPRPGFVPFGDQVEEVAAE
jgi:N6-adenosine-specific RNA methylase IME4